MKSVFSWSSAARAAITQMDRETAMRILHALTRFAQSGHGDIKALHGPFAGETRLRVGDWRIRFKVTTHPGRQIFHIVDVENRGQAY
jgi:mRNA-degrading endonuclease RelE of RelBE toxin-antitoxin system